MTANHKRTAENDAAETSQSITADMLEPGAPPSTAFDLPEASDLESDPLSPTERKALLLLAKIPEPGEELLPLKEIARRCGITDRHLARIRGKAQFMREFQALMLKRVAHMLPAILAASFETAREVGKEGFQDRKLLLQLGGLGGLMGTGRQGGGFSAEDVGKAAAGAAMAIGDRLERTLHEAERLRETVIEHEPAE